MFDKRNTAKELQYGFKIPPRPEILAEIDELTCSPGFSLTDLGEPLSKDAALSSAVLQVVNSSLYGLNRTVVDVSQAVCFLGIEQIKAIVSVFKLRQAYQEQNGVNLDAFWSEKSLIAQTMLFINKWLGNKQQQDLLFTLGLFHDCGIAAMAYKFDDYMDTYQYASDDPTVNLFDLENQRYSTEHATIGYFIASSWHFPKPLCQMIRFHNDLEFIERKFPQEARANMATLLIADGIIRQIQKFDATDLFLTNRKLLMEWLDLSEEDYVDLKDDIESQIH